jgi:hypothetical protein
MQPTQKAERLISDITVITFVSSLFNDNNNIIPNINTNKPGKIQRKTANDSSRDDDNFKIAQKLGI